MTEILYIDPGTGGMLFTMLFGLFGVVVFSFRALMMRMKFRTGGGKNARISDKKIPLVIFAENKRYWNVFEPILDELERRQKETLYLTCSEDDPVFEKKYEFIKSEFLGKGNKAFSKLNLLNASVVLSTTPSLGVFQWKRSRDVDCYIHIPHMPNDITTYRMFGTDHFDALILSGQYQADEIRQLEKLRGIEPREIELCGIPYMDEMKKRLDESEDIPSHGRTVLLAPSWGESGILNRYGADFIESLISTGYKVIVRPHPQSFDVEKEMLDGLMSRFNDPEKVEWNRDNNNFDVLRRSDILISDFSGVLFDFALVFDKPVIYTKAKFDPAPYDAAWIEEPLWTFRILPSLGMELNDDNIGNIKDLIDRCIEDPSFGEGRDRARSETWVHMGEGAKRAADFVIRKCDELTSKDLECQEADKDMPKSKPGLFSLKKGTTR